MASEPGRVKLIIWSFRNFLCGLFLRHMRLVGRQKHPFQGFVALLFVIFGALGHEVLQKTNHLPET